MRPPATIRDVMEEKAETFFESGNGRVNWRYLPGVERSHLVLGARQLGAAVPVRSRDRPRETPDHHGEGNVTQLLRVDEKNRLLYFVGVGKEKGRDPYFRHFYRDRLRRRRADAAHAGRRGPRRHAVAVGPLLRRQLLEARLAAGRGAARRERQADPRARESRHLEAAGRRLEAADADHRESARRRRPISTA